MWIRFIDLCLAIFGIIVLFPFFILAGIWVKLDSTGPILFKQIRVGRNNKDFSLIKFRTMKVNSEKSGLITVGADKRVTKAGEVLRKYKLDELPQLINVVKGDMSLVGPRPEVRKFVKFYSADQLLVLKVRPGITDYASIAFSNENKILADKEDPHRYYIEKILPAKLELSRKYSDHPTTYKYFLIIFRTLLKLINGNRALGN